MGEIPWLCNICNIKLGIHLASCKKSYQMRRVITHKIATLIGTSQLGEEAKSSSQFVARF